MGDGTSADGEGAGDADSPAARLLDRVERMPIEVHVGLLAFGLFLTVALRTPLDVDEGFYALAAELVASGKRPYADFFYPQAPLHPYVLAPLVAAFGPRFVVLRVVGAALSGVAAALVAHLVHRETRSPRGAFLGAGLFATHELAWQWLPTVRPYALGAICALGSLALATPRGRRARAWQLVLAGAIAAIAPLARLPLAPVVGVVALAVLLDRRPEPFPAGRRGAIAALVLGVGALVTSGALGAAVATGIAALVLVAGTGGRDAAARAALVAIGASVVLAAGLLPFWLGPSSREGFVYGLVGYHADTAQLASWPKTRPFLAALVGGGSLGDLSALGSQDVLLLFASLTSLALPNGAARIAPLVGVMVLGIGGARHTPHIEHYATPLVAYLAVTAGITATHLAEVAGASRRLARVALVSALALYLLATAGSFTSKWLGGKYGNWDMRAYRPSKMDAAAKAVAEVAAAHPGPVLAMWPGSALGTAARVVPGYEDHFARLSASKHEEPERTRLHLTSEDDLKATMRAGAASVVVLDREAPPDRKPYEDLLAGAGYVLERKVGDVAIYVR